MKSAKHFKKNDSSTKEKEQFLIAYVLARASTLDRNPNVYGIVRDANAAWDEIQKTKEVK